MIRLLILLFVAGLVPPAVAQDLTAREIIVRAHAAAGGEAWVRPRTLHLQGHAVFFAADGTPDRHERYEMWRVYPDAKADAHRADGQVRIQSWRAGGAPGLLLAFDGVRSYTAAGPQPPSEADRQWSENFGYGVIRFALDPGYQLARRADDSVDGAPTFTVEVTDPAGGRTLFSIDQAGFEIRKVGFSTPRGWHERVYSAFFTQPGVSWSQPGRVRLYYNGVKQNEVFWRRFELNEQMPLSLFQVPPP